MHTISGSGRSPLPEVSILLVEDDGSSRHSGFALLFTDYRMPGQMDGIQLADLARAENPGIKVVVLSGSPSFEIQGG